MLTLRSHPQAPHAERIKLLAAGNAGINLLDRVFLRRGGNLPCAAINTEAASLNASMAQEKLLLGQKTVRGLGCSGDTDLCRQALEESAEGLADLFADADAAICLAGLGGGTGGCVLLELQRIAQLKNFPLFHIVTLPFSFEGPRRSRIATETLSLLRQLGGAAAAFPNERMGIAAPASGPVTQAFAACDQILESAIIALVEVFSATGPWQTTAAEVFRLLVQTNPEAETFFTTAVAKGGTRAHDVVPRIFKSPLALCGAPVEELRSVLIHISSGESLSLAEIRTVVDLIRRELDDAAEIHIGFRTDRQESQELAVTIFGSTRVPADRLPALSSSAGKSFPAVTPVVAPPKSSAAASPPVPIVSVSSRTRPEPDIGRTQDPQVANPAAPANPFADSSATPEVESAGPTDFPATPESDDQGTEPTKEAGPAASAQSEPPPPAPNAQIPTSAPTAQDAPGHDLLPGLENVPSVSRPPIRTGKKSLPRPKQEVLPLDVASRGRFERSEPTIEEGEDLDIPTFIRLKIRIK